MDERNVAGRTGGGCPFDGASARHLSTEDFDAFDQAYQLDPAAALKWMRDQEPVFYSKTLGYWVVCRYDDVKQVFRDNVTFSARIALERMTPAPAEVGPILEKYNYAMHRTLVNEEEPLHMERRRILQDTFLPENLAQFEPMVRRLTREYMNRFIDKGEVDLVDEMLWEIPLTVALHFLGVPEEDMGRLRKYSIAHTVNVWGRPSPVQQIAVADTIGKFWHFCGITLEKMRRDPSGSGWMHLAIRRQQEHPDLISDSFLHSNLMAGIVAAHETTSNATANAFLTLLRNRSAWDNICADSSLIPNAVEECLRHSGSVVAWRRVATMDTEIGGVSIPKDAKLLIVSASANHDERHFINADELDIFRENTTDHLTFGYGSHQCLGKNLARMQMCIYIEEFSRRLPHMKLVADQDLTYLPSVAFRGPEHLRVVWDPALNPERADPGILDAAASFGLGPPQRKGVARTARVAATSPAADGVLQIVLEDPDGRPMPPWQPGAHIDLQIGDVSRSYSLCGRRSDPHRLEVAVLRLDDGRGGSKLIHDVIVSGMPIKYRGPKNHFALDERQMQYLLVAGGIGITPILAMADRLKELGKAYEIHYCGRSMAAMAFLERLERDHGSRVHLYARDQGRRLDIRHLLAAAPAQSQVYACGPEKLLSELQHQMADRPEQLHTEFFSTSAARLNGKEESAFEVDLTDSKLSLTVSPNETLLQTLRAAGIDVPSDCEEGLCGSCEVPVTAGDIDHRDKVLTAAERARSDRMMACCSRGRGKILVSL